MISCVLATLFGIVLYWLAFRCVSGGLAYSYNALSLRRDSIDDTDMNFDSGTYSEEQVDLDHLEASKKRKRKREI